ncbi:MAG: hypothetical protein JW990_15980 [Thermoleophilia bacterium]|nr:hypothetical protein [Thermoleophilia bacterium]
MNTVSLVLPTTLLLYFLWRSMRQRVFLLGLPFLMDMYYSVFFHRLKPFWVPSQWEPADHMMFWLLATWIVYFDFILPWRRRSVRDRRLFGPRLSPPEELVLLGLAAYMILKVGTTALHHMDLGSAISEARIPLYVFAGYFLLRGVLCHAGRRETVDLLAAIVVVNSIAACLYVLHQGLSLYIYSGMIEYQYIFFGGEVLTRSFYFMPQYLPLAVAFCAARRSWSLLWVGVLAVTLAATWVSYTRTLVLVAIVEVGVILAVRLLRQSDAWSAVKRLAQISLIIAAFAAAALALLPTQSAYLLSRIEETGSGGSALEDHNLQWRLTWWRTTNEWLGDGNRLYGVGFPSAAQDARVTEVGKMAPDIVWVPTLWNLGLLGVALLAAMFIAFAWRATSMSLVSEGDAAFLSNTLLGVIVGVFMLGFVEWTIFDPWHTPLALSFFALLAAERHRQRAEAHDSIEGTADRLVAVEGVGSC